jgi:hypothetical protein
MLKFECLMSNSYFGNVKYKTFILKILDFTFLLDLYKNLGLIELSDLAFCHMRICTSKLIGF